MQAWCLFITALFPLPNTKLFWSGIYPLRLRSSCFREVFCFFCTSSSSSSSSSSAPSSSSSAHSSPSPSPSSSSSPSSSDFTEYADSYVEEGPDYIFEPSAKEIIAELKPRILSLKIYSMLLNSITAEHAARIIAMQTASDNAQDLLDDLTLEYNKERQQQITSEILDIVAGSQQ